MSIYNWIFENEKEAEEFYTEYLHKYRNDAFWIIFRYVKKHRMAERLLRETMHTAMKKAHQLGNWENSRIWLLRIARNQAKQYIRKHDRNRLNMFGEFGLEEDMVDGIDPSELSELIRKSDANLLREAFSRLDEETSIIFWLHVEKGDPFESIAEILEVSPETVAMRFRRGISQVAAYVKEKEGESF